MIFYFKVDLSDRKSLFTLSPLNQKHEKNIFTSSASGLQLGAV